MHHKHKEHCCECPEICSLHDVKKLDELIYGLSIKLGDLSEKKLQSLFYGYYRNIDVDRQINKISMLRKVLLRHKLHFYASKESCICSESLQKVVEKVIKEIGKYVCPVTRRDLEIDDSMLEAYLMSKPPCVSYDTWNKYSKIMCGDIHFNVVVEKEVWDKFACGLYGEIGFSIEAEKDSCDINFEISKEVWDKFSSSFCGEIGFKLEAQKQMCDITFDISKEIIPCNLLYTLSLYKEMCDLKYRVNRTDEECKLDYEILAERYGNINLNFKDYHTLVKECNMSLNTIDQCYRANLELVVLNNRAYLKTSTNTYPIDAITPSNLDRLIGLGFKITIDNIISNEYK